jgi:hypothetical protein
MGFARHTEKKVKINPLKVDALKGRMSEIGFNKYELKKPFQTCGRYQTLCPLSKLPITDLPNGQTPCGGLWVFGSSVPQGKTPKRV